MRKPAFTAIGLGRRALERDSSSGSLEQPFQEGSLSRIDLFPLRVAGRIRHGQPREKPAAGPTVAATPFRRYCFPAGFLPRARFQPPRRARSCPLLLYPSKLHEAPLRPQACFLEKFPACGRWQFLPVQRFAFRNAPSPFVLASPERPSRMDEQHLQPSGFSPIDQETCAHLGAHVWNIMVLFSEDLRVGCPAIIFRWSRGNCVPPIFLLPAN